MIRATIIWRPVGLPVERFTGIFKNTFDATLFAIEQLAGREGKTRVQVSKP